MHAVSIAVTVLLTATIALQAGPEHLIKQRAKDVAGQSNERQGAAPAQPAAPATAQPAPTPQPAQPAGPPLSTQAAAIRDALANVQKGTGAGDDARAQLERSLGAAASSKAKPSQTTLAKLSTDLARTVPGTKLNFTGHAWLASQLESVVKGAVTSRDMDSVTTAVHDFLRDAGAGRVDAMVLRNDLKAVIVELQQASTK
jgi:hypothetical protein